jgi:hypothetical protein
VTPRRPASHCRWLAEDACQYGKVTGFSPRSCARALNAGVNASKRANTDLAQDIAAFTIDGGLILIGRRRRRASSIAWRVLGRWGEYWPTCRNELICRPAGFDTRRHVVSCDIPRG